MELSKTTAFHAVGTVAGVVDRESHIEPGGETARLRTLSDELLQAVMVACSETRRAAICLHDKLSSSKRKATGTSFSLNVIVRG